jgi:hypothetical protein
LNDQVEGAVFTTTQPVRSFPLKSGSNPSGSAAESKEREKIQASRIRKLVMGAFHPKAIRMART